MAYTALARTWRPKKFAELVGQEHVRRALVNALDSGRVHHAFLFTGTRGVGKTTIARIFAKCLNCDKGVTAEPCGTCSACTEIDAGRFVDLIEVDAASRTKVDDTRDMLDNVQYAPTRGRYKVYLIDEVHMLSTHSFNALLKTLEEPPPHVKFLLATTDPQKLPVTVLSRCLQFNLKRLPISQIADRMREILEKEGVAFEPAGLRLVAQAADGSMRDGLSLLDQLIAFGGGKAGEEEARAMLGTISRDHVVRLAELLGAMDVPELVRCAQSLEEWAPDYAQVLDELASLFVRIAMKQAVGEFEGDELYAPEVLERLAKAIAPEDVQLFYQTAITGRRDLGLAPDPRSGFEMTLLRMIAFRPADDAEQPRGGGAGIGAGAGGNAARAPGRRDGGAAAAREAAFGTGRERGSAAARDALGAGRDGSGSAAAARDATDGATRDGTPPAEVSPAAEGRDAPSTITTSTALGGAAAARAAARAAALGGAAKAGGPAAVGAQRSAPQVPQPGGGDPPQSVGGPTDAPVGVRLQNTGGRASAGPGPGSDAQSVRDARPRTGVAVAPDQDHVAPDHNEPWADLIARLDLGGAARQLASNCIFKGRQGAVVRLALDAQKKQIRTQATEERLTQALSRHFGEPVRLEFETAAAGAETPAQAEQRASMEDMDTARRAFESDPGVQGLRERFGATVLPDTVRPVK